MSALDLRPLWSVFEAAFGVPITLTRPAPPDNAPVTAVGVWVPEPPVEEQPFGSDLQRREPRRLMAIARTAVATMPRGTSVTAAETVGGPVKTWTVDGINRVDADHWRVILVLAQTYPMP